ncbi:MULTISPECIES: GH25 family lysozyme [unclassified Bacillus (in: firmicutes)]|uniref:GH25 family lysozyme n=1 Tax=unclassified Bacillus (in: firmicutes) TaxID=185979 RepID=UPI0008E41187|nr:MULTISPECIES: GH25 family lysozyme [unclassified Bacillus (in: firmicutes)]SFI36421.1 Lyzozyme M1 (1,4-beta-N-acetylmuramidase), GH25 family [Bacillus sp. 71mf]SFT24361.1 Lyzozyme M1 (1,4-beta-N-acetylmuramidase), GH25 family [Bacillus sp. 103mf]
MTKNIVDISKYNDSINWDVAAQNLDLAICRVQYGSNKIDNLYKQHVANLEERGIPHAAYAYGCYVSVEDAIVEARDFMARVSPNAKFLVLDVEDDTLDSCGATNLAKASQAFIDTLKDAGWKVGFYVSHHMYGSYGLENVKADFLWIPRYGKKPAYPCDIWQYADNATGGYVEGIGNCDVNKLVGDKDLNWFVGNEQHQEVQSDREESLGTLTTTSEVANIRKEPNLDAQIMRTAVRGQGHTYYDWFYDGQYFWFKVNPENWMRNDVVSINKDGKNKGVVWVNGTDINLRKGASTGDTVINKITKRSAYDVHYRYENWIYVTGEDVEGWMYFDESYVSWLR